MADKKDVSEEHDGADVDHDRDVLEVKHGKTDALSEKLPRENDVGVDPNGLDDYSWNTIDPLVIDNLARGVLEKLQPDLSKSRSMLEELTENQRILIETIQQENKKFTDCHAFKEVDETMEKAKFYHTKLLNIKKDMVALHERSAKLKKRALRLQQQKNKEILEREQSREVELERERMLIARPAKNPET